MFSDPNAMKLDINSKQKSETSQIQNKNLLLKIQWVKDIKGKN